MSNKLCDWGCNLPATHTFKNGKNTCSNNASRCPIKRKLAFDRKKIINIPSHNKKDFSKFIEEFKQHQGENKFNNIDWTNVIYTCIQDPIKNLYCKRHNKSFGRYSAHQFIRGSGGCEICSLEQQGENHKITINVIQQRFIKIHDKEAFNNIDWSNAKYIRKKEPIENLICIKHNEPILTIVDVLLRKSTTIAGCFKCRHEAANHYPKEQQYLDTRLFYQSRLEKDFLDRKLNLLGETKFKQIVKNGSIFRYINPYTNKEGVYKSDFRIENIIYEIKCEHTWFEWHGKPQEQLNIAKLNAAKNAGYDVILVLDDGIEMHWPVCVLKVDNTCRIRSKKSKIDII